MRLFPLLTTGLVLQAACSTQSTEKNTMENISAPMAEKKPHTLTKFDHTRIDPYFWLNQRDNPEVIKYLKDENAYTEKIMSGYKTFREKLYKEMRTRVKEDDISVPYFYNGYYYYSRYNTGSEYAIYLRCKKLPNEGEETLIDVNELAHKKKYCEEGVVEASPNNQWLAFTVDYTGRRIYGVYFKNLKTGQIQDDGIKDGAGDVAWCTDNQTVFYTAQDLKTLRSYKIMRHVIGTPAEKDICVYEEKDETFGIGVYTSKSGKYVFIHCQSTLSTEVYVLDADKPEGKFSVFQPREKNHEYFIDETENEFYVRTNWNAKNFRLMKAVPGQYSKENWKEVLPQRTGILLEGCEVFKNHLVAEWRDKGITVLEIVNKKTGEIKPVTWNENDYTVNISVNEDISLPFVRVSYTSLKTPYGVYDINLENQEITLQKEQPVLGGYDKSLYTTERMYVTARDGKNVPVSIVYKTDLFKKGKNPLLLYGYGSYGVNIDPTFQHTRVSLLDRGFVFAIAHIRGSQTLGREWYEDGKMLNKKNSFTDFIDCTEGLVKQGYSHSEKVFAMGGSAGGLLMGAVANMRPELYKGIIAGVPFVDVVTTMLDESVPLTTGEYDEWGNPNDKTYYDYMLSYSPYDNVEKKNYPAMLVETGLHDSQVQYWEPAKWVAKLRDYKTDNNVLILNTNMEAGHGGASGRFEYLKEVALEYAFMCMLLEIKE